MQRMCIIGIRGRWGITDITVYTQHHKLKKNGGEPVYRFPSVLLTVHNENKNIFLVRVFKDYLIIYMS